MRKFTIYMLYNSIFFQYIINRWERGILYMDQFLTVIGELFLIICVQSVFDVLISEKKQPYMKKIISLACYIGSMIIVLNFMVNYLFASLSSLFRNIF